MIINSVKVDLKTDKIFPRAPQMTCHFSLFLFSFFVGSMDGYLGIALLKLDQGGLVRVLCRNQGHYLIFLD